MEWIYSPVSDYYIMDERLSGIRKSILITYQSAKGRKFVKQVECNHGLISKKGCGEIIAWMPLPEPANQPPQSEG